MLRRGHLMRSMIVLTALLFVFASVAWTSLPNLKTDLPLTRDQIATELLQSNAYPSVNDMATALRFADALILAYQNATEEAPTQAAPFPCKSTGRSDPRPTIATRLLPGDIDLIIGLGDSLTAAFGADARSLFDLFVDYRGTSFSAGGAKSLNDCSTVPSILKVYNDAITGWSTGSGNQNSANARLNVAVTGATSFELTSQVESLLDKIRAYPRSDWKLVTLFVGANDLCASCNDNKYSAINFRANVEYCLDTLQSLIPNQFINLILPPDVTLLSELTGGLCSILHPFECGCNQEPETSLLHKEYIKVLHDLVDEPKYHNDPDFAVVIQPFLEDIDIPRLPDGTPDYSYFAPDCFHFSGKSHSAAGLSLWNNMMESTLDKKRNWVIGEPFECPEPGQYLQ